MTGIRPFVSAPSRAVRRASGRHVKSCFSIAPYRQATFEATAPGSKGVSTARYSSPSDQCRRRPSRPVITSTPRLVAQFGSSVWSILDTNRSSNQEITITEPVSGRKVRRGEPKCPHLRVQNLHRRSD